MKLLILLWSVCLCFLGGCGSTQEPMEGTVITAGGNPYFFELKLQNGDQYGFAVTEETEIVWEDKSAFALWENAQFEYDGWDVFGCDMHVTVVPGDETESLDSYGDTLKGWFYAKKVTVTGVDENYFAVDAKPVIYLYPETPQEVSVKLLYDGTLTCTYPKYIGGWKVTAYPDGTLADENGKTYNYLYWEGIRNTDYDFSEGFCVKGTDSASFLEDALSQLGLTRQEANEFIVYWLPQLEKNPYNLIAFQTSAYTDGAKLVVSPQPDTTIRVFMAFQPLEESVEISPQILDAPERVGFTLVEWGGTCLER